MRIDDDTRSVFVSVFGDDREPRGKRREDRAIPKQSGKEQRRKEERSRVEPSDGRISGARNHR